MKKADNNKTEKNGNLFQTISSGHRELFLVRFQQQSADHFHALQLRNGLGAHVLHVFGKRLNQMQRRHHQRNRIAAQQLQPKLHLLNIQQRLFLKKNNGHTNRTDTKKRLLT